MPKYWKTDSSLILNNFSSNPMATLSCSTQGRLVTGLSLASKIGLNFWRLTLKMMCSYALHLCFLFRWRVSNVVVKAKVRFVSQLFLFSPSNLSPLDHTSSLRFTSVLGVELGCDSQKYHMTCFSEISYKEVPFFPSLIQASLIPTSTADVRENGVKTWTSDKNLSSAPAIGQWARVQNTSFGDCYMTALGGTYRAHSWSFIFGKHEYIPTDSCLGRPI